MRPFLFYLSLLYTASLPTNDNNNNSSNHIFGVNLGGWLVIEGWLFPDWVDSKGDSWRSYGASHPNTGCLAGCQNTGGVSDKPKTYTDSVVVRDLLLSHEVHGSSNSGDSSKRANTNSGRDSSDNSRNRSTNVDRVSEVFEMHYQYFLGSNFELVEQALRLGTTALRVPIGFWSLLKPGTYESPQLVKSSDFQTFGLSENGIVKLNWRTFYPKQSWLPGDSVGSPNEDYIYFYTGGLSHLEELLNYLDSRTDTRVSVLLDLHAVAGGQAAGGNAGDTSQMFTGVCVPSIWDFWKLESPHWKFFYDSLPAIKAWIVAANTRYTWRPIRWFTPMNEPGGGDSLKQQAIDAMGTVYLQLANVWSQPPNANPSQLVLNLIGDGEMELYSATFKTLLSQWPTSGEIPVIDWHVYHGYARKDQYPRCGGRCGSGDKSEDVLLGDTCAFVSDWATMGCDVAFPGYQVFVAEYSLSNCPDDYLQCFSPHGVACDATKASCYNKDPDFLTQMFQAYCGGLIMKNFWGSFFWTLAAGNGYNPNSKRIPSIDFSDVLNMPWSFLHLAERTKNRVAFNSTEALASVGFCESKRSFFPPNGKGCTFSDLATSEST